MNSLNQTSQADSRSFNDPYLWLIQCINDITRKESDQALERAITFHLLGKGFGFNFYNIAIVNKLSRKCEIKFSHSEPDSGTTPIKLFQNPEYTFESRDIFSVVNQAKKPVKLSNGSFFIYEGGNEFSFYEEEINIKKYYPIRENETGVNQSLEDWVSIFFPIIHRGERNGNQDDTTIGIAHLEFNEKGFFKKHDFFEDYNRLLSFLSLYIDNLAQALYKTYRDQELQMVKKLTKKIVREEKRLSRKDPLIILKRVLESSIELIGASWGSIKLYTFDSGDSISLNKKEKTYTISEKVRGELLERLESSDYSYPSKLREEITDQSWTSYLNTPILFEEEEVGYVEFISDISEAFDKFKETFCQNFFRQAFRTYQKLKFDHYVFELAKPFNLLPDQSQAPFLLKLLMKYFGVSVVSIWLQDDDNPFTFKQAFGSRGFKKICSTFGTKSINLEYNERIRVFYPEDINQAPEGYHYFLDFAKKKGFKAVITIPLILHSRLLGIINLYSKRRINRRLNSYSQNYLTTFGNKCAIHFQNTWLISSFVEIINESTEDSQKDILQMVAERAIGALSADIVFCYILDDGGEIYYRNSRIAGKLLDDRLEQYYRENGPKRISVIQNIIGGNKSFWLKSRKESEALFNSHGGEEEVHFFDTPFWEREEIKSLAVVPVRDHNGKPRAIMLLNFRKSQTFSDIQQLSIEAFSKLIGYAVVNHENRVLLEKQKNNAVLQMEKAEDLMSEILPKATRTSFYLILQGINHEVKNLNVRMAQAVRRIKRNSDRLFAAERKIIENRIADLEQAIEISENLLSLFDFEQKHPTNIDINKVIRQVIFFFRKGESKEIEYDISGLDDGVDYMNCHRVEFTMIIYNLLSNAVNAIRDKGIQISDKKGNELYVGRITFFTAIEENQYIIKIEDNGMGIDKKNLPRIYDPGASFRKKNSEKGTGIGLYWVKQILLEHFQGEISCNSRYGQGTSFTIQIPYGVNFQDVAPSY